MFLLTCGSYRIFAANLFYGKALAAKHSAGFFAKLPGESAGNFGGRRAACFSAPEQRTH